MNHALALLVSLRAQIPEGKHFRLILDGDSLAAEFHVGGRVPRYGFNEGDLGRPVSDLVDEIVSHHMAHGGDLVQVPCSDISGNRHRVGVTG